MFVKIVLEKYKNMPLPVKAAFWMTVCSFLQKGISVLTVPIFTRLLTTAEYGTFSVFISWQNIFILFTSLSLYSGVFNSAMIKYEKQHNQVVSSYLGLITVITVLSFGLYILFKDTINVWLGMDTFLMLLFFIHLILAPAFNLWMAQQRFEYNYKIFVIFTITMSVSVSVIGIISVIFAENKLNARIISTTCIESIFYLCIYILIFFKGRVFYNKAYWKEALIVNIPLIPHFLSGTILNQADRIMINSMVGASEAGIYSVAYSIAMLLQIIINGVISSIVPWLYKKMKQGTAKNARGILNISTLLMATIILCFMLFVPEIMVIFVSSEYYEAISMFQPLTVSVFFIFVYNLFCSVELYFEKTIYITATSCLVAILNIISNYFGISRWGYEAAAYTTMISYLIYMIAHYFCMKFFLKEKQMDSPIDIKFIGLLSLGVFLSSVLINFTYKYQIIRYWLLIIIIVVIVINKNKILNFVKEIKNR